MSENARTGSFEHIELFGTPALFSNCRIDRNSLPNGVYCYDLRGSDYDCGQPMRIAPNIMVNHAGSVLMLAPIDFSEERELELEEDGLNFLGEELSLNDFCMEHHYPLPAARIAFDLYPATTHCKEMFYALPAAQDAQMGAVGHVRMDFGKSGTEFFTSWWQRGPDARNNEIFKAELDALVNALREAGPLKDSDTMQRYCNTHGGCLGAAGINEFGYIIQTQRYRYYLRCIPTRGDYNAYLTAFSLPELLMYEGTLRVTLPDGRQLRARVEEDDTFQGIQLLIAANESTPQTEEVLAACLEYSSDLGPNHDRVGIGVTAYIKDDDEPAFYASFN